MAMDRIEYIMKATGVNEVKARIYDKYISDIPDGKLSDFFVFVMKYLEPYKSYEVAMKEAAFDFNRIGIRNRLKNMERLFSTPEAVKYHLETFYKGRDVAYGPAIYLDHVVIAMNRDGELVNKYRINDHGNYSRLNADDAAEVIMWLFENQHRIGDVKIVPERDVQLQLGQMKAPDEYDKSATIEANVIGELGAAKRVGHA